MKIIIASLLLAATLTTSISANAALIKFDVGALTGFFTSTPLNGSFFLDTDTQLLSEVNLTSGAGVFNSGVAIDNASGFGLSDTSFFFSGVAELLFEVRNFDRFMPQLAAGQSANVDAFVSQGDEFNSDFVNVNPFSANSDVFQGSISVTRANDVPVPMGLSFLVLIFAGFSLLRRSSTKPY
ncbi:hypothetical protein Glaag_2980 [Glaciecola sp. 4H-3-7+YE-5]|nr:hypothetical protein Glaag_2980 [Glaciecola sp. 4H-3-7+YE-5]